MNSLIMKLTSLVKYQDIDTAKQVVTEMESGNKIDYKEYPELSARLLLDYVNGTLGSELFVKAIMESHRALQQSIFNLFVKVMRAWAKTALYDERNQEAIKRSKQIIELLDK